MKIYNSMTHSKEEFVPLHEGEALVYVCGPTVYNYFHIGNARPFVVFDTLRRYLEYRGLKVNFVQNFTDVDDKILARASEEGISSREVADNYIEAYFEDAQALGVRKATAHPRVTENIAEIISFIETLVEKGHAYAVSSDVYFDTESWPAYGKLSGQDLSELRAGARVDVDERKRSPLDFALWKEAKEGEDLFWDSPWGRGRPGWHIECSAMSRKYLGATIDIHAGGQDLIFPHHENEIAQSEAANGVPFARVWMHNGYITIDKEKMAKSKGNFFTVRDVLKEYDGEAVRFFLLAGHYRGPVDFSRDLMEQSKNALARMRNAKETLEFLSKKSDAPFTEEEKGSLTSLGAYREKFIAAMDDDLNTADAIAVIFELISEINLKIKDGASGEYTGGVLALLLELSNVLGLLENRESEAPTGEDADIRALAEEREQARAAKNWARADEIRELLKAKGIVLKDTPQGVQILREDA
ncbi:MAG: cysteine--tRNA ligase [Clostridiales bacterium]|nr:cysteine--tRNA ligase [Clostridiales bacterium]